MKSVVGRYEAIPEAGCWIWSGSVDERSGYGRICIGNGKWGRAHRAAYEEFVGPIPSGMMVCHRCDVRCCINPDHLFLGTAQDNTDDAMRKKRNPSGMSHGNRKLTNAQVAAIREDVRKHRDIAKDYCVSFGLIGHIKRGMIWRDAP